MSPFRTLHAEHAHIVRVVVEFDVKFLVSENVAYMSPAMLADTAANSHIETVIFVVINKLKHKLCLVNSLLNMNLYSWHSGVILN